MEKTIDGVTTQKTTHWVQGKRGRRMRALSRLQDNIANCEKAIMQLEKQANSYKGAAKDEIMSTVEIAKKDLERMQKEAATLKSRI
jgi:SMC interacting uncharacterized protein involved in chromosome segregation